MSTLNKFWKIILSYKWGLLVYIAIFGGLAVGMTFLMQDTSGDEFEDLADVPIAIFDRDETELTDKFVAFMTDLHDIVEVEDYYAEWLDAASFSVTGLIVEIPAGFTESFLADDEHIQLEYLASPVSTNGFLVIGQTERYFNMLTTYLAGGFDLAEASELVAQTLSNGAEVEVIEVDNELFAEAWIYYRFLPIPLLMVVAIAIGGVFMALNKQDVIRRIESAPVSYKRRTFERIVACVLFGIVGWALFIIISFVLFGAQMAEQENLIRIVNSLPLVFLGIAIAFIVTQFIERRDMLMSIVFPLVFALATPAGILFDMDMMGEQVLAVARFTPLYWYSSVNEMMIWETTVDWGLIWQSLVIQTVFAAALLAVGMVFSKEKRARRS